MRFTSDHPATYVVSDTWTYAECLTDWKPIQRFCEETPVFSRLEDRSIVPFIGDHFVPKRPLAP